MTVQKKSKSKKGFTLVEIIVVLVILAILAAAGIPSLIGFVGEARGKALVAEARAAYVASQAVLTEDYLTNTPKISSTATLKTYPGAVDGDPKAGKLATMLAPDIHVDNIIEVSLGTGNLAGTVTGLVYSNKYNNSYSTTANTNPYYVKIVPGNPAEVSKTALTLTST